MLIQSKLRGTKLHTIWRQPANHIYNTFWDCLFTLLKSPVLHSIPVEPKITEIYWNVNNLNSFGKLHKLNQQIPQCLIQMNWDFFSFRTLLTESKETKRGRIFFEIIQCKWKTIILCCDCFRHLIISFLFQNRIFVNQILFFNVTIFNFVFKFPFSWKSYNTNTFFLFLSKINYTKPQTIARRLHSNLFLAVINCSGKTHSRRS